MIRLPEFVKNAIFILLMIVGLIIVTLFSLMFHMPGPFG